MKICVAIKIPSDEFTQALVGEIGFQARFDVMANWAEQKNPGWKRVDNRWKNDRVLKDGYYEILLEKIEGKDK